MNKQPKRKIRTIALFVTVALLSLIISVFLVACNSRNTNGDNNNANSNGNAANAAIFETIVYKMMTYGKGNLAESMIAGYLFNTEYEDYSEYEESFGNGYLGYCYFSGLTVLDNERYCYVFIYNNSESATSNLHFIRDNFDDVEEGCIIFQDYNFVVVENRSEIYQGIISSSQQIPSFSLKQKEFITAATHTSIEKFNSLGYSSIYYDYTDSGYFHYQYENVTLHNHAQDIYVCTTDINADIDIDNELKESSYDNIEDGTRYVYAKLKSESKNEN